MSGTIVRLKGRISDNVLIVDKEDLTIFSTPEPTVEGTQNILGVLVNFKDTEQPDICEGCSDTEMLYDLLIGDPESLNYYIQEVSYNRVDFVGDAIGWYELDMDRNCDFRQIIDGVIERIDSFVDFQNYQYVSIIAPVNDRENEEYCEFAGMGTSGRDNFETDDGDVLLGVTLIDAWLTDSNHASVDIFYHEVGHNLGLDHSNFYNCGDDWWRSNWCVEEEYHDIFSSMGMSSSLMHYTAGQKEFLRWFLPRNIHTVVEEGIYSVIPLEEENPDRIQLLKIPRDENGNYLFFEYRQPIGFDQYMKDRLEAFPEGTNAFDGALVHIRSSVYPLSGSALLEMSPPAFVPPDCREGNNCSFPITPALEDGVAYTDSLFTNIEFAQVSHSEEEVRIQVRGGELLPGVQPNVSLLKPHEGDVIRGRFEVKAESSDSGSGVEKLEFLISKNQEAQFLGEIWSSRGSLWKDSNYICNGKNEVYARAFDRAGHMRSSNHVEVTVGNERHPPSVDLIQPHTNDIVGGTIRLGAYAYNLFHSIASVSFYLKQNNRVSELGHTSTGSKGYYFFEWNTENALDGSYELFARVEDECGNTTESTKIRIEVMNTPTVELIAPQDGATVNGIYEVTAQAQHGVGINRVEFWVRRYELAARINGETGNNGYEYWVMWDTTSLTQGEYQVYAKAYDVTGGSVTSDIHTVYIFNEIFTPFIPDFDLFDPHQLDID